MKENANQKMVKWMNGITHLHDNDNKETDTDKLHRLIIRTDFLETENKQLKEEIKILKANNDHICTGKLPY